MNNKTHFNKILDHIVLEMETTDMRDAISSLAGVLDGGLAAGIDPQWLRRSLLAHPIGTFLAPNMGQRDVPTRPVYRELDSSTGKRLSAAVEQLSFSRGIRSRAKLTAEAIEQAWKSGKKICVLDGIGLSGMARLANQDTSNIMVADETAMSADQSEVSLTDDPIEFLKKSAAKQLNFDLIVATGLADGLQKAALANLVKMAAQSLSQDGILLLSSFTPEHFGLGWRTICQGETVHCHDQEDLATIATAEGLAVAQFYDASGCLIWAELNAGKE